MTTQPQAPESVEYAERVQREVERSVLRARNGIRYVAATRRMSARRRRTSCGSATAPSSGGTAAAPIRYAPPLVFVHSLVSRATSSTCDRDQHRRVLPRPGLRRVHARLGRSRRARRRQRRRDVRRRVPPAGDPRGATRDRASDEVTLTGYCLGGRLRDPLRGAVTQRRRSATSSCWRRRSTTTRWARWSPPCAMAGSRPTSSSTRRATYRPTRSTRASTCRRRRSRSRSTRRCSRTCGTTSSWTGTRRWRSGRATTCRFRARRCARSSTSSCERTCS